MPEQYSNGYQRVHPATKTNTFAAVAVGATTAALDTEFICHLHTVQVSVSGTPTDFTVKLQGSLDGVTYFDVSDSTQFTGTTGMFHVSSRPVRYVQCVFSAATGGTSPQATFLYAGAR